MIHQGFCHVAHQLPALLSCPMWGKLVLCLQTLVCGAEMRTWQPLIQTCTDLLHEGKLLGASQASVACAGESVSKAVAPLTFHGVASHIPGVLSLRKIVGLILLACS